MSSSSSRVSTETPCHTVSSFDHLVTQWMSTVTSSLGRARNSSQVQRRGSSTSPTIEKSQRSSGVCGVGRAERRGKSGVTYWPAGTRPAGASPRPARKPREMSGGISSPRSVPTLPRLAPQGTAAGREPARAARGPALWPRAPGACRARPAAPPRLQRKPVREPVADDVRRDGDGDEDPEEHAAEERADPYQWRRQAGDRPRSLAAPCALRHVHCDAPHCDATGYAAFSRSPS